MSTSKLVKVILSLHDKTVNHGLKWEETDAEYTYQAVFPQYRVRILRDTRKDTDEDNNYTLQILNKDGEIIDSITDESMLGQMKNPSAYDAMRDIYETARRIAMGLEDALDHILNTLEDTSKGKVHC